jgi:hypothetical protein
MSNRIEYNGYVIESTSRFKGAADGWTLEVRITPRGRRTGVRRCRAPNLFETEELAVTRSLAFGQKVVDGKARRRTDTTR